VSDGPPEESSTDEHLADEQVADEQVADEQVASAEQRASHPSVHWREGRRTLAWPQVLMMMVGVLAVWLVLDSSTLLHNAEVSPVGARRSASIALLRPIASASNALQLTELEKGANLALGRTAVGGAPVRQATTLGPVARPRHHRGRRRTTSPDQLASASAANPVRILLVGDSLGLDLGGSLQNALASTGIVTATLDGKESTGLTRPDYFNWPAELSNDLTTLHPQVIVAMMGANDPQDFLGPPEIPFGTAAWNAQYVQRTEDFMRLATSQGAKLVWVSLPGMQDPALNSKIAVVNQLQKQAAAAVPGVVYLDSGPVIGGTSSPYSAFIVQDGQNVNVRTPDGIHITPQGGDLLARYVMAQLRARYQIPLP
jgi:uncharacterized protein